MAGDSLTCVDKVREFMKAAERGHLMKFNALLSNGLTVNTQNKDGFTALHFAAYGDRKNIADRILHNSMFDNSVTVRNARRLTVLHLSAKVSGLCVAKAYHSIYPDSVNSRDDAGNTPLHSALEGEKPSSDMLMWLMSVGADLNIKNNMGYTPLMTAIRSRSHGIRPMINALIEQTDTNSQHWHNSVNSALHIAVLANDITTVKKLLQLDAKLDFLVSLDIPSIQEAGQSITLDVTSENMATLALRNLTADNIDVVQEILKASATPPAEGIIFEFYCRFFKRKAAGLPVSDVMLKSADVYEKFTDTTKCQLIRTLAMALALCSGPVRDELKLKKRFRIDGNIFSELTSMYSSTEGESHAVAIEQRKQLLRCGLFHNVTKAMAGWFLHPGVAEAIDLGWVYTLYASRLSKLISGIVNKCAL